jgi:hypothetical protein
MVVGGMVAEVEGVVEWLHFVQVEQGMLGIAIIIALEVLVEIPIHLYNLLDP